MNLVALQMHDEAEKMIEGKKYLFLGDDEILFGKCFVDKKGKFGIKTEDGKIHRPLKHQILSGRIEAYSFSRQGKASLVKPMQRRDYFVFGDKENENVG